MTYEQVFKELCPTYIAYGMTYNQYWYGNPWMARDYSQAYLLKRKVDNESAWIHGAYVFAALNASLSTLFGKRKNDYLKKPVDLFPKTKAEIEEEKRAKRRKLIEFLTQFARKSKKNDQ